MMADDLAKVYQNLLYSKQTYDKGKETKNKGQQTWAANNATQYYGQLGADEANAIKGMNAQGLADYIKSKQAPPPGQDTTSSTGGGVTDTGVGSGATTSQAYIDKWNDAKRNQVLADLGKSRDNALLNLAGERSGIQPRYYDARNATAAESQQSARNLAEFMAARGNTSSGSAAQAELSRNMSLQGNLGSLNRQENADLSDIDRRTTGVKNAYESDLASANAGIEGDKMQALLNDFYTQQQRELQIAGLMGSFNNQRTLAGQQFDRGILESDRNYNRGILESDRDYELTKMLSDRDFNYQVGRDDVADAQFAQQFAESVRQNGIQNALAQVKASSKGSGGTKDLSLAQKISIWKISGQAPEGIPGITPGTKVYDEVAARKAAEKSGGVKLWDAIKGVIGSVAKGGGASVSDGDIKQYLK